jgi:hypothetical protein
MASASVHVPDTWDALCAGNVFPGGFSPDGTVFSFPVVESLTSRGSKIFWCIQVQLRAPAGLVGQTVDVPYQSIPFNTKECLAQPVRQFPPGYEGVITSNSWHDGSSLRKGVVPTIVKVGKNVGKKNATNAITQSLRNALGLYNKHLKGGGHAAGASDKPVDNHGLPDKTPPRPLPMLVKKLDATVDSRMSAETLARGVTLQRKLNGVRMVVFNAKLSGPTFYSRTAGEYQGMSNLRQQMAGLLAFAPAAWTMYCANIKSNPWIEVTAGSAGVAPTVYLDGELYKFGKGLNWISGESRSATGGDELEYWVFDCFFPELAALGVDLPGRFRQQYLDTLFFLWSEGRDAGALPQVVRVENFAIPTTEPEGKAFIFAKAKEFVVEGFEGAIARKDDRPYRYGTKGYHSSNLVKIKPLHDAEYIVIGYTEGTRGKDVGAVIWICTVPPSHLPGGTFSVVPKNMTYAVRYQVYKCLSQIVAPAGPTNPPLTRFDRDFRGRPLTVEFPELSAKTGIPSQAKALSFRTYEPGAGYETRDPLERLLAEC